MVQHDMLFKCIRNFIELLHVSFEHSDQFQLNLEGVGVSKRQISAVFVTVDNWLKLLC